VSERTKERERKSKQESERGQERKSKQENKRASEIARIAQVSFTSYAFHLYTTHYLIIGRQYRLTFSEFY